MISKNKLKQANTISIKDLLIRLNEPIKKVGKSIRWPVHDSISITNNLWYQHSMKRGGLPVDFLITFFGFTKKNAIDFINSEFDIKDVTLEINKTTEVLVPPNKATNMNIVKTYLTKFRFIDEEIYDIFVLNKLIYEDNKYNNCNFVGFDRDGNVRHIHYQSTHITTNSFKANVLGSNSAYSFHWVGKSNLLYVFESPIDLLSYITLNPNNWKEHSYLALCGLSTSSIERFFYDHSQINTLVLGLDNDIKGLETMVRIKEEFSNRGIQTVEARVPHFKDYNEDLKYTYNQDVTIGISDPFYDQLNETYIELVKLSKGEKDKTFKELINQLSIVYYGVDFSNPRQVLKYRNALISSGLTALMLARQQYRHFEKKYTIEEMINHIKDDEGIFMEYCETDSKLSGFTNDLERIKTILYSKIYLTKDEKEELVQRYMSLAKRCIYTHVFLDLKEKRII